MQNTISQLFVPFNLFNFFFIKIDFFKQLLEFPKSISSYSFEARELCFYTNQHTSFYKRQ